MEDMRAKRGALEWKIEWIIVLITFFALLAGNQIHLMLTVGDWDFWTDFKDQRWWPTFTPLVAMLIPASMQYIFWQHFRLPIGATACVTALLAGQWINRIVNFHGWAWFPLNFVWPATLLPGALALDAVLVLTGSYLLTAIFGGMAWGVLFFPANWPMLAPFRLPVAYLGRLMSVADVQGFQYIRAATPEYIRMIDRGTLRTFGGSVVVVSGFLAGVASVWVYAAGLGLGRLLSVTRFLKRNATSR